MNRIIEIKDFQNPELDVYARLSEVQLLRACEPKPGLFIAESPRVIERAIQAGYCPVSFLAEKRELKGPAGELTEKFPDIPVYTATQELLTQLTGFALTRGMLCAMKRKELLSPETICADAQRIVILEDVVNPTNVEQSSGQRQPEYGCGSSDCRMQRSPVPESCQSQYGNCVSDSLDQIWKKGLAGKGDGLFSRYGI